MLLMVPRSDEVVAARASREGGAILLGYPPDGVGAPPAEWSMFLIADLSPACSLGALWTQIGRPAGRQGLGTVDAGRHHPFRIGVITYASNMVSSSAILE
jgi:hypothetical protein